MKKSIIAISFISFISGISVVSVPLAVAYSEKPAIYSDSAMTQEVERIITKYEVNEKGLTFGTGESAEYVEDLPDLVAVIGDNGKAGYVYTKELLHSPATPEEAIEYQKTIEDGTYIPVVLNVYNKDGETIIDTFTESISNEFVE